MSSLVIQGGNSLHGEIKIQGSKNSVLPILAATILNEGTTKIYRCPRIADVLNMIRILEFIGCKVFWNGSDLTVDASVVDVHEIPADFLIKMRSSVIFLGALIGRLQKAVITYPGGCSIGSRPIDLHLKALRKMNVQIIENGEIITADAANMKGTTIRLRFPSVGATQNIMLSAVLAEGITIIHNAAQEPEIIELSNFLNTQGGCIEGAGTDKIKITGMKKLHDAEYTIRGDRIVAGTYMAAVTAVGGKVTLTQIIPNDLSGVTNVIRKLGCNVSVFENHIVVERDPSIPVRSVRHLKTQPYPGFPTDMQSQVMTALAVADGRSTLREAIFESRFKIVPELNKMGANIRIVRDKAIISGVDVLHGCEVDADDLRGGAALVIAGLKAEGITRVNGYEHVRRGYENIVNDLRSLGASIRERG